MRELQKALRPYLCNSFKADGTTLCIKGRQLCTPRSASLVCTVTWAHAIALILSLNGFFAEPGRLTFLICSV